MNDPLLSEIMNLLDDKIAEADSEYKMYFDDLMLPSKERVFGRKWKPESPQSSFMVSCRAQSNLCRNLKILIELRAKRLAEKVEESS